LRIKLFDTVIDSRLDKFKKLISQNINVNQVDVFGKTAIEYIQDDQPTFFDILLKSGANVHLKKDGTVLHSIGIEGSDEMISKLVSLGVDINTLDSKGKSVIHLLAKQNRSTKFFDEKLKSLIKNGADIHINYDGLGVIGFAYSVNNFNFIESILKYNVDESIHLAGTITGPLLFSLLDNFKLFKKMVKAGADVHAKGPNEENLLFRSVLLNDLIATDFLISKGVDVNAVDEFGTSVLVQSSLKLEQFKLLLNHIDISSTKNVFKGECKVAFENKLLLNEIISTETSYLSI